MTDEAADWLTSGYPDWIPDPDHIERVLAAERKLVRHWVVETSTYVECMLFFFSLRSSIYFRRRPCGTWAKFTRDKTSGAVRFVDARSNNRKYWTDFRSFLRWLPA